MRTTSLPLCGSLLAFVLTPLHAADAPPDIAGTWVPVPAIAEEWNLNALPLTDAARDAVRHFDPARLDSSAFCMPFGTPRNTLNTAHEPFEILQTENQVTFIFDRLGDVRRIYTDGRETPEDPIPGWMGYSIGQWQGEVLEVNTIAMTAESILTDAGLPHSESLQMHERLSLANHDGEWLLRDNITLRDPDNYREPLETVRYFRRAPQAAMSEGSALCLLNMWRKRLEDTNREMYRTLQATQEEQP